MNKFFFIGLSIAITAFIAANALLMFGEKSIISKNIYVSEYERAYPNTYIEKLPKEAVAAPRDTMQIYVQEREAIEQWVVSEGDVVQAGSELALLNEVESQEQRTLWESEQRALEAEKSEVQNTLRELESAQSKQSGSESESASDRSSVTNEDGDTIEFNVDLSVGVEVPQDGSYATGIAQANQRLAAIDSQLAVIDAQLSQSLSNPALVSPVEGIVAKVNRDSNPLSVEIYSTEKTFMTYVLEDEWQDVAAQDRVLIQAEGLEAAVPGTVLSVSEIPAEDSRWLKAYRALDPKEQANPIAFYEVQILADEPITENIPFGSTANAEITINEAVDAVAIPQPWIFDRQDTNGSTYVLNEEGYGPVAPVTINFDVNGKAVLSDGVGVGAIVLKDDSLREYKSAPKVFMPFPSEQPNYEFAKNTNWRKYIEYLLAR
ncbi:efflux RND transporter periplasmic adaptor subunit [Planococcus liqunii]|uniref:Efflux RND transporter periplasmic adaptor subunit n=1 Tax=Planococcus liqunii TaxID=3058394 RepID=A0ABT8MNP5_9BACL|nr:MULTISPECIES: efflux RND transporter periplasmic adaptor subunit [unclassified Planococcus (in: firmicutes)]MDN7226493.1 efflux RND transporter periplasmic adaptor subunit [Planococcus sp. N064]WKA50273.1 efflux RND transporter periplasmic adaptor subunit [Planococcus sp. N056]